MKKINISTKAFYGLGSYATGIKENAFGIFLLFYYTQVVGLTGSLAGIAVLCALIVDAISDPVIGYWSDNFHSKWGRRHPFMYASIFPLAVSFILLFNPPSDMSSYMMFIWMLVFSVAVRFSITFYTIPSSSMAAEMTSDYHERTALVSFRVLFAWAGSLSMSYLAYNYLFVPTPAFEDGRFNPAAYQLYSLIGAALIIITIFFSALGTHRIIPYLHEGSKQGFSVKGLYKDFFFALKNKTFLILFIAIFIASIAAGFLDVFALYMNTYFWEFSSQDLTFLLTAAVVGALLAFISMKTLALYFDKKRLMLMCMAAALISGPLPVILRLFDVLPENGSVFILYLIFLSTLISVFSSVVMIILAGSMIADVIDLNQKLSGKRQEGMFYAATSFSAKATTGVGGFIAGLALDIIHFPAGLDLTSIDPGTLVSLGVANVLVVTLSWGGAIIIMSKYTLTREKHAQILVDIQA